MNIKYFTGLIISVPAAILLLHIFMGKGTEPTAWVLIILFGVLSLPWNIEIYIAFTIVIFLIAEIADIFKFIKLLELMKFDGGLGIFIWLFYLSFIIGCHINGAFIFNSMSKKKIK